MSKSQQLRDEFLQKNMFVPQFILPPVKYVGGDAAEPFEIKGPGPNPETAQMVDALIAEVRKEVLEEACRAACWKCEAKTPVVNHRGIGFILMEVVMHITSTSFYERNRNEQRIHSRRLPHRATFRTDYKTGQKQCVRRGSLVGQDD